MTDIDTIDISKLASILHPLEKTVLPLLGKFSAFADLLRESKLKDVELVRALQWLQNKNIVKLTTETIEQVVLEENGKLYKEKGLPEDRFLAAIKDSTPVDEILKSANLDRQEMSACLGVLKGKAAIEMQKSNNGLIITITEQGKKLLSKESLETQFLKHDFPIETKELEPQEKLALTNLKKRKNILRIDSHKKITATITDIGRNILKEGISTEKVFDRLTPGMLKLGSWKDKKFRPYDTEINVPKIYGGRKHPLTAIMDLMRQIFIEMGFEEMKGPWVESSFWCMDSMWIPQDHPAREVQDTFHIPLKGDLPEKELVDKVKEVHETGGATGSKGYGYVWNPEIAKQLLLRTHTTATTYRYLHYNNLKDKDSAKYFYIGRIFRNEALDATHLPEFHQIEGFVMNDDLSLRHLMGIIKEFYARMGIHDIKFKVTYNPYTESSLEALYFDKKRGKWLELINSGVFRPESLAPYGIKKPIIAWGLGVERLAMVLYELDKLKDIFGATCDFSWLKDYKIPVRKV